MGLSKTDLITLVRETVQELLISGEFIETPVKKLGDKIDSIEKNVNSKLNVMEVKINQGNDLLAVNYNKLKEDSNANKKKIMDLENVVDKIQQNEKSRNLCIYGLGDVGEGNIIDNVLNMFNNSIRADVRDADIAACYRVGGVGNKSRPVIVKFVNINKRNSVLALRRNLKGTNMGVTEDLTKRRLQLYKMAQAVFQRKSVFTRNGNIHVKIGETRHKIFSEDDIRKLNP